jgi:hypothetical protein
MPAIIQVRQSQTCIQATRTEPAKQVTQFLAFTPIGVVACATVADVEKIAADFGATIQYVA